MSLCKVLFRLDARLVATFFCIIRSLGKLPSRNQKLAMIDSLSSGSINQRNVKTSWTSWFFIGSSKNLIHRTNLSWTCRCCLFLENEIYHTLFFSAIYTENRKRQVVPRLVAKLHTASFYNKSKPVPRFRASWWDDVKMWSMCLSDGVADKHCKKWKSLLESIDPIAKKGSRMR